MYEYKCASCGEVFEVMQKFSDQPLQEHPGCGGPVERLISAPALQFKGSGWYVTDYGRTGSGREKPKTDSSDAGKNGSSKPAPAPAKENVGSAKPDK
jgi:putative FmdB family regulatory protein